MHVMAPANIRKPTFQAEWLDPQARPEWDAFVERHEWGSIYHTSAWCGFLENCFSHMHGQIAVIRDENSGSIIAGMPVFLVRSRFLGSRYVSIPYGMSCDPLISSRDQGAALLEKVKLEMPNVGAGSLEIKTHRSSGILSQMALSCSNDDLYHYLALDEYRENLWRNLTKGNKWCIHKAEKNGIRVQEIGGDDSLDRFYPLHQSLRKRLRFPPFERKFFKELMGHFGAPRCTTLFAQKDGRSIAAVLLLHFRDTMIWEYSGDCEEGRVLGANHLLIWTAILRAKESGCRCFAFGRTGRSNPGLTEFKRSWGSVEEELSKFAYPHCALQKLVGTKKSMGFEMVRTISGIAPAPIARWIGALCYRHWG